MIKQQLSVLILLAIALNQSAALIYTQCKLVNELVSKQGIAKAQVANWDCLANAVSGRNTAKIASGKYGIYQISSPTWCKVGSKGGTCNVKCEDLVATDLITEDVACAKKIYAAGGFASWPEYNTACKAPPNVDQCLARTANYKRFFFPGHMHDNSGSDEKKPK